MEVVKVFQFVLWNLLVDKLFDRIKLSLLVRSDDSRRVAFTLRTARTADAVNLVLRVLGHVVVDDVGNVGNIKST